MIIKTETARRYIDLLKKSLVNELYVENEARIVYTLYSMLNNLKIEYGSLFHIAAQEHLLKDLRESKEIGTTFILNVGRPGGSITAAPQMRNFTELSHTMIGKRRLENIQYCVETVLENAVPGDVIETGIWRGGATIFMRGLFAAYGVTDRTVWAADSFEGVPPPSRIEDAGFDISAKVYPVLAVTLENVQALFKRYDLLDDHVKFLKGWFKDTLPAAPIEKLSVLRLDGDLYESTMDAIVPLYDKVSKSGFIIVDDYYSCPPCKRAIDEFRASRGIADEIIPIDTQGVYWKKS